MASTTFLCLGKISALSLFKINGMGIAHMMTMSDVNIALLLWLRGSKLDVGQSNCVINGQHRLGVGSGSESARQDQS